jgi:hypothetical protein
VSGDDRGIEPAPIGQGQQQRLANSSTNSSAQNDMNYAEGTPVPLTLIHVTF